MSKAMKAKRAALVDAFTAWLLLPAGRRGDVLMVDGKHVPVAAGFKAWRESGTKSPRRSSQRPPRRLHGT